jgi:alkanesulfonate monooxygenase SsuD/methylene tetrahydromethanopterin reductase-like flavin-dependent oxidoreductase (luciferase family)
MKFFLGGLGNWPSDYPQVEKAVLLAEDSGFDGALIPDHYQYGSSPLLQFGNPNSTLDAWIALTYLAGKTTRIHLGTLVTPIPFRPPGITAKMVTTLDVLSGGRVIFGVGAGWSKTEFEGYSTWDKPKIRVDKTKEGLELMIKLWTQDKVTHKGTHYKAKNAVLDPKPVQTPYPKLLFGGAGKRMLKLAGKYADICYTPRLSAKTDIAAMRDTVLQAAKRANRVNKLAFLGGTIFTFRTSYNPEQYVRRIEQSRNAGDKYYLVALPRSKAFFDNLKSFAKDIMPSFR